MANVPGRPKKTSETEFTTTESYMYRLLSDGQAHTADELKACLPDEMSERYNIWKHLTNMRKKFKLRNNGLAIVCEQPHGEPRTYRLARYIGRLDE